ncbi:MAG: adenosylcobinamide-GDP ribazoletransferase [Streptosporangiales bacterium]|nr:adenosylcobinamide-GDP ribazoletransferase [Streptosporangiales bacterium]
MSPLRTALSLFTVLPVAGPVEVRRVDAKRAVLCLPVVGVLLAAGSAAVLVGVRVAVDGTPGRLLAGLLAVGLLAVATGALHLDGLADTADGLGSRRPASDALAIMRRSDIGPMGVVALGFALACQVVALAAVPIWWAAAALCASAVAARVGVVLATGAPGARTDGFGALVTGAVPRVVRYAYAVAVVALAALPGIFGAVALGWRLAVAASAGLLAGALLRAYAVRRLGGVTGDVYGAVVETVSTTTLVTLALLS